jgi:hypothetical protein
LTIDVFVDVRVPAGQVSNKKGLSFISNRQRWKEGTFCASELAEIEPTPPAPKGAGYVRLDHLATVGIKQPTIPIIPFLLHCMEENADIL